MRCVICCSLQMGFGADFLIKQVEEANFQKKYKSFIVGTVMAIKSGLETRPWDIKAIYYNDESNEFQGVSGRRKSNIIDGFEDLYLYVSAIVRTGTGVRPGETPRG